MVVASNFGRYYAFYGLEGAEIFHTVLTFCQVIFSDNCDLDRLVLQRALAAASAARLVRVPAAAAESTPSLPALDYPPGMAPNTIIVRSANCAPSALACSELMEQAHASASSLPGNVTVLGFDCEWAASLTLRRQVAVIQLSSVSGYTVIFQVKTRRGSEAGIRPSALKELMEDPEIQLVSLACNYFFYDEESRL